MTKLLLSCRNYVPYKDKFSLTYTEPIQLTNSSVQLKPFICHEFSMFLGYYLASPNSAYMSTIKELNTR